MKQFGLAFCAAAIALLAACSTPTPAPPPAPPPASTSFECNSGNTPVQNAVCASPQLAALDIQLAATFRQHMGMDDIFTRDQILAAQRGWLLGLQTACNVTATINVPAAESCLASAYQAQIAVLTHWSAPAIPPQSGVAAISHYVQYKQLDAQQPALCSALGAQAAGAMSGDGSIDPTRLQGAQEIAGSHGNPTGADPQGGGNLSVDLYRAGLYGGYDLRARGVTLPGGGSPVIGPESVGSYLETLPNGGGRYVAFASQTNDYGDIDVFTYQGQLVALATDVIGPNSPAPPGEAAVAAAFILGQDSAAPACMFQAYITPPPYNLSIYAEQPSLTPFLALIDAMTANPSPQLAPSDRQDSGYLAAETRWMLFNMPQVVLEQARNGGWTGWLRSRHDQVLDTLFASSQQSPANKAEFDRLFALLRPAAVDLDTIYVQHTRHQAGGRRKSDRDCHDGIALPGDHGHFP